MFCSDSVVRKFYVLKGVNKITLKLSFATTSALQDDWFVSVYTPKYTLHNFTKCLLALAGYVVDLFFVVLLNI